MKNTIFVLFAVFAMVAFQSCTKATAPTVSTVAPTDIQYQTATLNGNVESDGNADVTDRGFIYSTSNDLTSGAAGVMTLKSGTGTGAFTSAISGLSPATTYYVKAYATNEVGTSYGSVLTFTTL